MKSKVKKGLIAVSVLLGVFFILVVLDELEKNAQRNEVVYNSLPPVRVKTAGVELGPVSDWVMGEGIVEAVRKRHLQFETRGRVTFVAQDGRGQSIREGDAVAGPLEGTRFGQILARLDYRDSISSIRQSEAILREMRLGVEMRSSALAQARNELAQARIDLERKQILYDKQLLPKSDLELAKTRFENGVENVESAEAGLAAAKTKSQGALANLDQTSRGQEKATLFAPFDGLVARINIREGDYYDPANVNHSTKASLLATAPITIIDPSEMEITLNVMSLQGVRVKVGQPVLVAPGGMDWFQGDSDEEEYVSRGGVHSVSPQLDRSDRTLRIKVRVKQQENRLVDGMYATCWIQVAHKPDVIRVPLECLLYKNNVPYVYVAGDGVAEAREIEVGIEDEEYVEVVDGLTPGEKVITRGRHVLSNWHPIQILEDEDE